MSIQELTQEEINRMNEDFLNMCKHVEDYNNNDKNTLFSLF